MCVPRNYTTTLLQNHFPRGFLAPQFLSPENLKEVKGIRASSGQDLDPLIEVSMSLQDMPAWSPTTYPIATIGYLIALYVFARVAEL
jgi:hypothetical protein